MNAQQETEKICQRIMHDAHLRFQRKALAQDAAAKAAQMPCPEVRGTKRREGNSERKAHQFKPEWFTHLRPNFWKAYFDTFVYMAR